MPLFLKLIPLKDWLYSAAIVALLIGFVTYTVHERHLGAAKIIAADKKVADAQTVHNQEVENVVKLRLKDAIASYDALQPLPVPVAVPRLVCYASGSGSVPGGRPAVAAGDVAGASVPVGPAPSGKGFDPAEAVSATGTDADAEIGHLLAKVRLLQDTILAYQAGGLVKK